MEQERMRHLRADVGIDGRADMMKQAADAIEELLAERDEVNAGSWKTAFEIERDEHRWLDWLKEEENE